MFAGERCPVNDNFVLAGGCCHKKDSLLHIVVKDDWSVKFLGSGWSDRHWKST